MKKQSSTIYEICRKKAGLTRDEASKLLNISPRSLDDYEDFNFAKGLGRCPPDHIVLKMAELYKAPDLPFKHLVENTEIGKAHIPRVEVMDLREVFLRYQEAREAVQDMDTIARKAVLDNQIGAEDSDLTGQYMELLYKLNMVGLSFYCSIQSKLQTENK